MCKILIMAGLNPSKHENTWIFAKHMAEVMSTNNDDGLGYAAVDEKGNLFGERWLFNEEAFEQRKHRHTKPFKIDKKKIEALKKEFGEFLEIEEESEMPAIEKYGTFGIYTPRVSAITLHARAASNTICYKNTHPFVDMKESVSVIHNGLIDNVTKEDNIRSTCDSERVLNQYLEHEVNKIPADIQNMVDSLTGRFACGIFAKDSNGVRVLDIFRTRASLGMVYVDELRAMVYSTDIDDVKRVCRYLNWHTATKAKSINEDKFFRLDALTGKPIISIKYTDTTIRESTNFRGSRTQPNWDERARQEREKREQRNWETDIESSSGGTEKAPSLTLLPGGRVYTEQQKQEIAELKKAGFDDIDIMEFFDRKENHNEADRDYREEEIARLMVEKGWDEANATAFVDNQILSAAAASEVKTAKELISQVVKDDDTMKENQAANDGWALDKQQGLWVKRQKH